MLRCDGGEMCVKYCSHPTLKSDQTYFQHPTVCEANFRKYHEYVRCRLLNECRFYHDVLSGCQYRFKNTDPNDVEYWCERHHTILNNLSLVMTETGDLPLPTLYEINLAVQDTREYMKKWFITSNNVGKYLMIYR